MLGLLITFRIKKSSKNRNTVGNVLHLFDMSVDLVKF